MGYELRIYAGKVSSVGEENGRTWFDVIGMVDLSKPGYESQIYETAKDLREEEYTFYKPVYWYNKNDKVEKDSYGDSLIAIPASIVISALEKDVKRDDYYRFKIALDFLKSMVANYEETKVVLFGH